MLQARCGLEPPRQLRRHRRYHSRSRGVRTIPVALLKLLQPRRCSSFHGKLAQRVLQRRSQWLRHLLQQLSTLLPGRRTSVQRRGRPGSRRTACPEKLLRHQPQPQRLPHRQQGAVAPACRALWVKASATACRMRRHHLHPRLQVQLSPDLSARSSWSSRVASAGAHRRPQRSLA